MSQIGKKSINVPDGIALDLKDNLSNSRLSLHLIGEDYGASIEGHDLSLVDLQNEIAN